MVLLDWQFSLRGLIIPSSGRCRAEGNYINIAISNQIDSKGLHKTSCSMYELHSCATHIRLPKKVKQKIQMRTIARKSIRLWITVSFKWNVFFLLLTENSLLLPMYEFRYWQIQQLYIGDVIWYLLHYKHKAHTTWKSPVHLPWTRVLEQIPLISLGCEYWKYPQGLLCVWGLRF